jgi:hypothetical protein
MDNASQKASNVLSLLRAFSRASPVPIVLFNPEDIRGRLAIEEASIPPLENRTIRRGPT